jgi:Fe-S cluster assembly protein SufD
VGAEQVRGLLFAKPEDVSLLVFVNGSYQPQLSHLPAQQGVEAMPLQEAQARHADLLLAHFAQHARFEGEPFLALSTAFAAEGAFVRIGKGKVADKPIVLLHLADATAAQPLLQPRLLLLAEENSQVTVVEQFVSVGEEQSLANAVTEIVVRQRAVVDHYTLQAAGVVAHHVGNTQVYQEGASHFSNTTLTFGGGIVRNNLSIALDGEHGEAFMNGLYLPSGRMHVDNHTAVDHRKPNCYSNELYKGLLSDHARGVFNGKIFVRQDAQKTNAFQSNNNIVLSEHASMDTKPQLEIWADDVKCSHGATVGSLDEEPMFYLRSRGIGEEKARALLMHAFAVDVLTRVKLASVREYAERLLASRLGHDF